MTRKAVLKTFWISLNLLSIGLIITGAVCDYYGKGYDWIVSAGMGCLGISYIFKYRLYKRF